MKNLFKNLMLVAVAAMAFTACQNDNNEVNEVAKKTVLDFVATIANQDDTRSGFTGTYTEGEDTYYQSGWDGDETFIVCANGSFNANNTVAIEDAEGHFSVAFEGNVPTFIDVYSPASAWNSQHTPTVPAVQTPRANSVDPAAHILKAEGATVATGMVNMQHKVAYGKMTVNTPADFEISKVELSLVGLPYSSWTDNQTYSYTINANEVEGNVFWFATETMQIVKEFTVTAYNAEGQAYSKTVTGLTEGKLAFIVGQVSTFSVSNLEAVVVPEEPEPAEKAFTTAYIYADLGTNDKKISFEGGSLAQLVINVYGDCLNGNIWAEGVYTTEFVNNSLIFGGSNSKYDGENIKTIKVTVSHVAEGYHILFENVMGNDGLLLDSATFTGAITGLGTPDVGGGSEPEPEPESPKFTSAKVAYDDGAEKYITFNCDNGALQSLTIDIINAFAENNTMLREGTYTHDALTQDGKIYASYSNYGYDYLSTISMTVTYVPEGYYIVFENVRDNYKENILFERATYTGAISGLVTPSVGGGDEPENPDDGDGDESEETYDSTYAYVYKDYGATDKEIMFVAEDGRGLRIDFYNVYNNNCLVPGTYSFVGDSRMYPNWCYYYANIEDYYTTKLNDGQAVVSVEDGQYKIVFTNMSCDGTVYAESFTFKGQIEDLDIP